MRKDLQETAEKIIRICQALHQKNMLAAADGNVSCRMSDGNIMITPTGRAKAFLKSEEMAIMNLQGDSIQGKPSSESLMHLTIYQNCPQAQSVVHAHPPTAIAWSIAHPELQELPNQCLSEVILACGHIPFIPYARPGTQQMGDVLKKYLPLNRAFILSRHGALCWGESLEEAYGGMERIEHSAMILSAAKNLGQLTFLPEQEVEALFKIRKTLGEKIL